MNDFDDGKNYLMPFLSHFFPCYFLFCSEMIFITSEANRIYLSSWSTNAKHFNYDYGEADRLSNYLYFC